MAASRLKHLISATLLIAGIASASSALAHAHLKSATPAADSSTKGVNELRLNFSEGVEQKFTKVDITQGANKVAVSSIATDPNDKKILIVTPAQPLADGEYKVNWHAVSVDTHKSEGSYTFKVSH